MITDSTYELLGIRVQATPKEGYFPRHKEPQSERQRLSQGGAHLSREPYSGSDFLEPVGASCSATPRIERSTDGFRVDPILTDTVPSLFT